MGNYDKIEAGIDNTDFAILFAVQQHAVPPWKNKIYDWIVSQEEQLPIPNSVSVQTVGRRVDGLVKNDLLQTVIVSPEEIKRDLIIAFKLAPNGEQAIKQKREELLKNLVRREIFDVDPDELIGKSAAITLIINKFGWNERIRDTLHDSYSLEELATFLVITYIEEAAENMLNAEHPQRFQDVLNQYEDMVDLLVNKSHRREIEA